MNARSLHLHVKAMKQEIFCHKVGQNTPLHLKVFSMTAASRLDTRRANLYGKKCGIFGSPGKQTSEGRISDSKMLKVLEAWLQFPAISGIDTRSVSLRFVAPNFAAGKLFFGST